MSKKDYQAIAAMMYRLHTEARDQTTICTLEDVTHGLCGILAAENPRFDRERFLEACRTGKCRGMWPVTA